MLRRLPRALSKVARLTRLPALLAARADARKAARAAARAAAHIAVLTGADKALL